MKVKNFLYCLVGTTLFLVGVRALVVVDSFPMTVLCSITTMFGLLFFVKWVTGDT